MPDIRYFKTLFFNIAVAAGGGLHGTEDRATYVAEDRPELLELFRNHRMTCYKRLVC